MRKTASRRCSQNTGSSRWRCWQRTVTSTMSGPSPQSAARETFPRTSTPRTGRCSLTRRAASGSRLASNSCAASLSPSPTMSGCWPMGRRCSWRAWNSSWTTHRAIRPGRWHSGPVMRPCSPGTCCSPGRSAGPTCPVAATRPCWTAWRRGACRCRTRGRCSPATGGRRPSARSAPATRSWTASCPGPARASRSHAPPDPPDCETRDGEAGRAMIRTHEAGELRAPQAGARVVLAGWVARRRDHGGVIFIDLRDASGVVQVVLRDEGEGSPAHALRAEFCVRVTGEVRRRPAGNENPDLPTGGIEVVADELEVLAEADPLPFPIEGGGELNEDIRLRYRYLDIRRAETAAALRTRSQATYLVSDVMREHGFVTVETPYLTRSTPEGARDFLVPVRLRPGSWYALPQSPQLFKQLLMVGGMERYWQLALCFRDEDFRADRQPEFTQVDVEMSFVTRDDIITVAEDMVGRLWAEIAGYDLPRPIPRMTYADAMDRFGSDKPDLRFGCELVDLTDYFAQSAFRVFQAPHVGAVVMPGGAALSRRELDGWQQWARARGARGLAYVLVAADGSVSESGPVARHLSDDERAGLLAAAGAGPGACGFFAEGQGGTG